MSSQSVCYGTFNTNPVLIAFSGMIQAVTNRQIGLKLVYWLYYIVDGAQGFSSVISELIVGFMLPGRPIALMM
jgi:hypothetical protein